MKGFHTRFSPKILAAVSLLGLGIAMVATAQDRESSSLFAPIPVTKEAGLTAEQEKEIAKLKEKDTTTDLRLVTLNLNRFQSKSLTLNVGGDKSFGAVTDRIETRAPNDFTWFGKIPELGASGDAILVTKDGRVTGNIRAGSDLYEVVPLGSNVHAIIKVDQSKFPPDEGPDPEMLKVPAPKGPKSDSKDRESYRFRDQSLKSDDTAMYTVRVLIAYTPAARVKAGEKAGIDSKIQLALAEANQSYQNSKIRIKMELAHSCEVTYTETGKTWGEDLARFREKGDGFMDEVHTLRDQHRAQVCALIVAKADKVAGLASGIGVEEHGAFCLVLADYLGRNFVLVHEIGHLMGAEHNWEAPIGSNKTNKGFWHKGKPQNWRTVMSYECPNGKCPRVPYWSNPDVPYNGIATGSKDCCDNAAVLNASAKKVSSFR